MLMEDSGFHQVDIGTIFPGESVTLKVILCFHLSIKEESFLFKFPMSFFPKYIEAFRVIPGDNLNDSQKI